MITKSMDGGVGKQLESKHDCTPARLRATNAFPSVILVAAEHQMNVVTESYEKKRSPSFVGRCVASFNISIEMESAVSVSRISFRLLSPLSQKRK